MDIEGTSRRRALGRRSAARRRSHRHGRWPCRRERADRSGLDQMLAEADLSVPIVSVLDHGDRLSKVGGGDQGGLTPSSARSVGASPWSKSGPPRCVCRHRGGGRRSPWVLEELSRPRLVPAPSGAGSSGVQPARTATQGVDDFVRRTSGSSCRASRTSSKLLPLHSAVVAQVQDAATAGAWPLVGPAASTCSARRTRHCTFLAAMPERTSSCLRLSRQWRLGGGRAHPARLGKVQGG